MARIISEDNFIVSNWMARKKTTIVLLFLFERLEKYEIRNFEKFSKSYKDDILWTNVWWTWFQNGVKLFSFILLFYTSILRLVDVQKPANLPEKRKETFISWWRLFTRLQNSVYFENMKRFEEILNIPLPNKFQNHLQINRCKIYLQYKYFQIKLCHFFNWSIK